MRIDYRAKERRRRADGSDQPRSSGTPCRISTPERLSLLRVRHWRPTLVPSSVAKRARDTWAAAKLEPIGLHDARHAAASVLIAAGVNIKALSAYLGHSSVTITLDRYGHLFPGNEDEAAGLVDAYLERMETGALAGTPATSRAT